MLKLVPFNAAWVNSEKLDMKAIYRRPRYVSDDYGDRQREYDADGAATWDIVGPLPLKQHINWTRKGFEYVTLANRESLYTAHKFGTLPPGVSPREFDQHATGGPWNARLYSQSRKAEGVAEAQQLKSDVERFGSETVEELRKRSDPGFVMPDHLKAVKAKRGAAA